MVGYPEAVINLSQAVIFLLAASPKSNAAFMAYEAALSDLKSRQIDDVPAHLRTPLQRREGSGTGPGIQISPCLRRICAAAVSAGQPVSGGRALLQADGPTAPKAHLKIFRRIGRTIWREIIRG